MPENNLEFSWWKGSFPSWIVFGLISVISIMGTRYVSHIESRWERLELRLATYVTISEFQAYQRMHRDWEDQILTRQDGDAKEVIRKLIKLEERQERLFEIISNRDKTH